MLGQSPKRGDQRDYRPPWEAKSRIAFPSPYQHAWSMKGDGTVLLVDDDCDVRCSFAEVLRTAGYRVLEAEDGLSAQERLKSDDVGVVLLDVFMPGLDGLSLLDEIENPPPVALLTAHGYDEAIMLRRSKVAMYIQKPIAPLELLEAVARMFSPG